MNSFLCIVCSTLPCQCRPVEYGQVLKVKFEEPLAKINQSVLELLAEMKQHNERMGKLLGGFRKAEEGQGVTESEAFEIWFEAFRNNYGGTYLAEGKPLAEQAWKAALNFAEKGKP